MTEANIQIIGITVAVTMLFMGVTLALWFWLMPNPIKDIRRDVELIRLMLISMDMSVGKTEFEMSHLKSRLDKIEAGIGFIGTILKNDQDQEAEVFHA